MTLFSHEETHELSLKVLSLNVLIAGIFFLFNQYFNLVFEKIYLNLLEYISIITNNINV